MSKKTEDILGIKIFKRTNSGVIPTEAGKKFIEYSNEIIGLIDKLNDFKNKYSSTNQSSSVTSMLSYTILDLCHNFKDTYKEKSNFYQISYKRVKQSQIL